jgi:heterodisulfide reductase subunit A-like polyferredoxin
VNAQPDQRLDTPETVEEILEDAGNGNRVKHAVVIGGGIAGIQAALDLADARIRVTLVEKSPTLGGRMAQLDMDCSI